MVYLFSVSVVLFLLFFFYFLYVRVRVCVYVYLRKIVQAYVDGSKRSKDSGVDIH